MHNLVTVAAVDFAIQIFGFIFAFLLKTEKFYDVTGSATFILLTQISLQSNMKKTSRQFLVSSLVTIWALRLGSFLFYRVLLTGGDRRFDKVKHKPVTFFIYWLIQGTWIFVTLLPVLLLNNKTTNKSLSNQDYCGFVIWLLGFITEVTADWQKMTFQNVPDNAGKFIDSGLWSFSRHPNYFGEILMWFGVFVIASTAFTGFDWLSVLSPIFVYFLLNYISGIPILERSSMKRYGHLDSYKHYVQTVPVLVPFIGKT